MEFLQISNDGPDIVQSTYWSSSLCRSGGLFLSTNAGAFRLLLPDSPIWAQEMTSASSVIVSIGPWPDRGQKKAVEIMFEDHSEAPFCVHLGLHQVDRIPPKWEGGREDLLFTVWQSGPSKLLELPAKLRFAKRLPFLRPWSPNRDLRPARGRPEHFW